MFDNFDSTDFGRRKLADAPSGKLATFPRRPCRLHA
jgi:hypothetical protein